MRSVVPDGPAARAGLQADDVIVAIAGSPVKAPSDVVTAIDRNGVNRPLKVEVQRGSRRVTVTMTPTEMGSLQL